MNIRSIAIVAVVLVVFVIAGPAQDWMFPITDPKADPALAKDPKADPVPATDPKANSVAAIDYKANPVPAPAISPKADPAPAQEAPAQDWTKNLYTSVGVNYLFQQDTPMDATASNGSSSISASGNMKFNSGFRGDVSVGYNVNKLWSVELDTGALLTSSDNQSLDVHADFYTVPFLANVIYKIPLKNRLSSYVGAGVGGAASVFSYSSGVYDPTDYTFTFTYQAEIGLQYSLAKNMSVSIGYKFLGMTDPTWKFTITDPNGILPPTHYSFTEKGFFTHSIGISLTWAF